jgi:hypothetical protein
MNLEYMPFVGLFVIALSFGSMIYFAEKQNKQEKIKNTNQPQTT